MSAADRPATLRFEHNGFRVVIPGDHVVCAVTAQAVPLEELRYWSVTRQEAYASCEAATLRLSGQKPRPVQKPEAGATEA